MLIIAEENSNATMIESYASTGVRRQFYECRCGNRAEGRSATGALQGAARERRVVSHRHTSATLGTNAVTTQRQSTLERSFRGTILAVQMDHEGAECWVDGLYVVSSGQHTDTHSVIDHQQPHCTSHQLYKGILDGKSRAVFNGKVFVRHGAQKTDAMQTNKNLLLSNEARVDTKPQLEILADDVKCAHGAAVGQIDEDELFYLRPAAFMENWRVIF